MHDPKEVVNADIQSAVYNQKRVSVCGTLNGNPVVNACHACYWSLVLTKKLLALFENNW